MAKSNHFRECRKRLLSEYPFCFWCDVPLRHKNATLDHLIPRSRGGSNHISNLVLACGPCNVKRGNPDISKEEATALRAEWPVQVEEEKEKPINTTVKPPIRKGVDWDAAWRRWRKENYGHEEIFGEPLKFPPQIGFEVPY